MRDIEITPALILGGPEQRAFFSRVALYTFVLYFVLPVAAGLLLPFVFGLTNDPLASLPTRLLVLTATGGASFLVALLPSLLLLRTRYLGKAYVFLLFPVSVVVFVTQLIMYREFGSEINERLLGLFHGNLPALWVHARSVYHLDWMMAGLVLCSVVLGRWILRGGRPRWTPGRALSLGFATLLLSCGSVALAVRPSIERADLYHPVKLSAAPLYQLLSFLGQQFLLEDRSGYTAILEQAGALTADSEHGEITRRLGSPPEDFVRQTVETPDWLRRTPSHVFLYLMESIEYDLVENPAHAEVAPHIRRFAREGVSVPNFSASSGASIDAIHGFVAGVATQPLYPGPSTLTRFNLDSLPRIAERAGYGTVFFVGMHGSFGRKGASCEAYGFDRFLSYPDLFPERAANEWGVCDGVLYPWAEQELAEGQPVFAAFSGVSNHAPYDAPLEELGEVTIPEEALTFFIAPNRAEKIRYARHIRYCDQVMAESVARLHAAHPDALFVFVGDHGSSKLTLDPLNQVPFVLWNPTLLEPGVDTSEWYGAHMDLPATLASLLLPPGETIRTLGRPVWDLSDTRVSVAGPVVLTNQGYLNRDGSFRHPFPRSGTRPADQQEAHTRQALLKASALDALSWGALHDKPLPPGP